MEKLVLWKTIIEFLIETEIDFYGELCLKIKWFGRYRSWPYTFKVCFLNDFYFSAGVFLESFFNYSYVLFRNFNIYWQNGGAGQVRLEDVIVKDQFCLRCHWYFFLYYLKFFILFYINFIFLLKSVPWNGGLETAPSVPGSCETTLADIIESPTKSVC